MIARKCLLPLLLQISSGPPATKKSIATAVAGSTLQPSVHEGNHHGGTHVHQDGLRQAENIFPSDPNSPAPIQQNTQPVATDRRYENGQIFGVTVSGMVTAVRFYAAAAEAGPHVAKLWDTNGTAVSEVVIPPAAFNGTAKWVQWPIGPVAVTPGPRYMITVSDGTEKGHHWAGCPSCWLPAGSNGRHIFWPAASARFGLFSNGSDMPGTTPQFGQSYFRDIVFCASLTAQCGPLPPPPPAPLPTTIVISGPRTIERPSLSTNTTLRRAVYRAGLIDQYGQDIRAAVSWSISSSPGVVVAAGRGIGVGNANMSATVSVDLNCNVDTVVKVSARAGEAVTTVPVHVQTLKPSGITITGPAAVDLSVKATSSHAYTAVVRDQLGQPIKVDASSIVWSLAAAEQIDPNIKPKMGRSPPKGVSISPATGVLSVSKSMDRGDFSVVATLSTEKGGSNGLRTAVFVAGDAFDAVAFLANNDTTITLTIGGAGAVGGAELRLRSLRHRTAGWEWIDDGGDSVPFPSPRESTTLDWTFKTSSQNVSIATFEFAAGELLLKSIWSVHDGGGPVEHTMFIHNLGTKSVSFGSSLQSLSTKLMTPMYSVYSQYEKRGAGTPQPPIELILRPGNDSTTLGVNVSIPVGGPGHVEQEGQYLPLAYINAGDSHGLYVGSEWELGRFEVSSRGGSDYLRTTLSVSPIGSADVAKRLPEDYITLATGSSDPDVLPSFTVPTVYYGVYQGGVDSGSNSFRKWFWDFKIVRSLHDNADEPWTEVCWEPVSGALFPYNQGTPRANQSIYEAASSTGVELLKIDCCIYNSSGRDWQWSPLDWPNGFDFSPRAHQAGLRTSLYLGGTYDDVNLSTIAGRDVELQAISKRFDDGWFDMWRTDTYNAPENPLPDSYAGVTNFLHIMDTMIGNHPGFRYENCANGGHFKGLALARRFTFVTTNDAGAGPLGMINYRQTHWLNSHVLNPLQLKCDLQAGDHNLNYVLRTCLLGSWLMAMGDGIFSSANYSHHIALYKSKQRPIMRGGNTYHLLPFPDGMNYEATQFHNPSIRKGSVLIFKPSALAPAQITLPLKGLRRDQQYRLSFEDHAELGLVATGAELMDQGVNVTRMDGPEASEIIWLEEYAAHSLVPQIVRTKH